MVILLLRPRDFHPKYRLEFVYMRRVVYTSTALDLRDDGNVHIALLRKFFLGEFLFASRGSHCIAGDLRDVLGFFCIIVAAGGFGSSCGNDGGC